jgi:hypothetical protein
LLPTFDLSSVNSKNPQRPLARTGRPCGMAQSTTLHHTRLFVNNPPLIGCASPFFFLELEQLFTRAHSLSTRTKPR